MELLESGLGVLGRNFPKWHSAPLVFQKVACIHLKRKKGTYGTLESGIQCATQWWRVGRWQLLTSYFFPLHHPNNKVAILEKCSPLAAFLHLGCRGGVSTSSHWFFWLAHRLIIFWIFLQSIETTITLPFPGKCIVFPGKLRKKKKDPRMCVLSYKKK